MCNLYRLRVERWEIADYNRAEEDFRRDVDVVQDYVAPGKPGAVVRLEDGRRVLSTMLWGFPTKKPRVRAPKEGQLPFVVEWWTNARNLDSNMWKSWLARPAHRCLVPFTEFSEPKAAAERTDKVDLHWWFAVENQRLPCFAGIWKEDPDLGRVFSFCTTDPNPLVAPKHPKAMPVILLAEDHDRWLGAPWDEARGLVAPYPSQLMAVG